MRILKPSSENIALAGRALASGQLVAMPTETVYGLAANAFDEAAVARVFEAKRRPSFDPLIVHIAEVEEAGRVVSSIPPAARDLMAALWPGPLTLILPKRDELPELVTSGLPSVALRLPASDLARALIRAAGLPLAAPSANPFGYLSPTTAEHVASMLGERVDYILDGGPCPIGVESTVLDMTGDVPLVLRPGGMAVEDIAAVVGRVDLFDRAVAKPTSPGQLPSHYAPHTPLHLVEAGCLGKARPRAGAVALCFDSASLKALSSSRPGLFAHLVCLSETGTSLEAAARLFSLLHDLDKGGWPEIWAERLPEEGLGRAVNDRLWKASKK
jgi:L-threonylcarbamoyladenylate synthase